MKPRTARYLLGAIFGNLTIVGVGFGIFIFLGLGPDGCAIEDACLGYSSRKYYEAGMIVDVVTALILVGLFNWFMAKRFIAQSNNVQSASRKHLLLYVILAVYLVPATIVLSWVQIDNHLQQRRLAGQLKSISVMQGCAESSRHYSKPGLITTYTCDSRLTNAVLYAEVVIRMHTIGYQTYYDRTYGSSLKYNAYEVGFSRGSYEAVYLFNNQTNFVDAQKSGMAEKSAGGYTLKLYDN